MPYDFKSLSPFDFELVVRDLLQMEFSVRLESFASGRDRGIDLRYAPSHDRSLIVQCKHYAGTGFAGLKRDLTDVELPKLRRLNPTRYVVATSVPMTVDRKRALLEALQPYIEAPEDILGAEDLNNLLGRHPDVERQHFKLWLTSTTVLERLLNNDVYVRSLSLRSKIEQRLRIYVQNESFHEALKALNDHHVVLIVGVPGIGKSILAEMLLVALIDHDYEPIVVSGDIEEAQRVYAPGSRKQAFYYDDFLGQTASSEKLGKNEDARLVDFIRQVRASGTKRLVMTTREYILAQASLTYERLDRAIGEVDKVILDLADYTRFQRAHILYNHLYFSELTEAAIQSVLVDKRYRAITGHDNYNPRLIETVTALAQQNAIAPEAFAQYMLGVLDRPEELWSHAFQHQLAPEARTTLLALLSLPGHVEVETLRDATQALHQVRDRIDLSAREFRDALRTLEGTFVTVEQTQVGPVVAFQNPSVRDYLLSLLHDEPAEHVSLLRGSISFDQVALLWNYARDRSDQDVARSIISSTETAAVRTFDRANVGIQVLQGFRESVALRTQALPLERRLLILIEIGLAGDFQRLRPEVISRWKEVLNRWATETGDKDQAVDLLSAIAELADDDLDGLLAEALDGIRQWFRMNLTTIRDYAVLEPLVGVLPEAFDQGVLDEVKHEFGDWADAEIDNILSEDSVEGIDQRVAELREVSEYYGVDLEELELSGRYEQRLDEIVAANFEDYDEDEYRSRSGTESFVSEIAAIDSLFDSLRHE